MKKLWLVTGLVILMTAAMAQRPGARRPVNKTSITENQAKSANKTLTPVADPLQSPLTTTSEEQSSNPVNNSEIAIPVIQNAKDNINIVHKYGQSATPVGHEAHAINGGYAALGKRNPWNTSPSNAAAVADAGVVPVGPGDLTTNFKWNGQTATRFGHEAASVNGYAALGRKNPWNVNAPIAQPATNATVTPDILNHDSRDNFKWNGQTATRFGHEAASVNGYAALGKKNPWVPEVNPMITPVDPKQALKGADNRDNHKLNGQTATKTGHEATAVGSGYASLKTRKE